MEPVQENRHPKSMLHVLIAGAGIVVSSMSSFFHQCFEFCQRILNNQNSRFLVTNESFQGLTIAQGCKRRGIPFTIFERDESRDFRPQGWALTLHWSLNSLRRTIGPELSDKLPEVSCPSQV